MKKKMISVLLAAGLGAGLLAGCGSAQDESETASSNVSSTEESTDDVQTITVAIGNAFSPYFYVDESGELTGFNVELWKAIDEELPNYEIELEGLDFTNTVSSLDTGKVEVGDFCFNETEERKEKYVFTDPFMSFTYVIATKEGTDYKTLEDLAGKKIAVLSGGSDAITMEDYNNSVSDDKKIILEYSDGDLASHYDDIINGRLDGYVAGFADIKTLNDNFGGGIQASDVVISSFNCYYLLLPGNEDLAVDISEALNKVVASDTYTELSEKWFGADVSPIAE